MQHNTKIYELPIDQFSEALKDMSVMELFSHWMRCGKQSSFGKAIMAEFKRRNVIKASALVEV